MKSSRPNLLMHKNKMSLIQMILTQLFGRSECIIFACTLRDNTISLGSSDTHDSVSNSLYRPLAMSAPTMDAMVEDDAALLDALDALCVPGSVDPVAQASAVEGEDTIDGEDLAGLVGAANASLRGTGDTVPCLMGDGSNVGDVLRVALRVITRLSDSVRANATLRDTAEQRASEANNARVLSERETKEERRLRKRDANSHRDELNRVAEALTRERRVRSTATADANELRASLARAQSRAAAAAAASTRQDRDLKRLQQRVHALLGGTRRPNLKVVVTGAIDATDDVDEENGARTYASIAADALRERMDESEVENERLRASLRAVHEELDALLETFPHVLDVQRQQTLIVDADAEFEGPPRAPSVERMMKPFENLEEELEEALVSKFKIIRRALCLDSLDVADYNESAADVVPANGHGCKLENGEKDVGEASPHVDNVSIVSPMSSKVSPTDVELNGT